MAKQSPTPTFDIIIPKGASFSLQMTLKDSSGAVRDLTGFTAAGSIKEFVTDVSSVVDFTMVFIAPLTSGRIDANLSKAQTAALDFDSKAFIYDIFIDNAGAAEKILQGDAKLELSVSSI